MFEILRRSRWYSRIDRYAERSLSRLVGRQHELELLLARFAEVRAGNGLAVFVNGEAGATLS